MVEIRTVYEGDLHCLSTHGPSGATLATDAPADNQGRGESFSPTDLVATALVTCMVTVMGIRARDRGWDLVGTRASVEKSMTSAPRRVARLAVEVHVGGRHDAAARAELEEVARTCPVFRSVHPEIEIPVRFHWQDA